MIDEGAWIGDPLRIGRPREIVARIRKSTVDILVVDDAEFPRDGVEHVDLQAIVVKGDALPVRRPLRLEVIGWLGRERKFLDRGGAGLCGDVQSIQTGFIGKVGDRLPIRRPGGRALHHSRRIGDVADRSRFLGHGQNFSVCFHGGPHAGRRNRRMLDFRGHVLDARTYFRKVSLNLDRNPPILTAGSIEEMDFSQLIVNQGVSLRGEAANIGTFVVENLGHRLRGRIVTEDSDMAGATGEEEDLPAAVDGEEIRCPIMRNLERLEVLEARDPDRTRQATAVVSPGHERGVFEAERRSQGRVGYVRSIRRQLPLIGHGQRQPHSLAALGGNRIQLSVAARRVPRRAKQNSLPIRRPSHGDIRGGMIGHAMRHPALRGDGEHIGIAVVLPRERDRAAVWRKYRRTLQSHSVGQAHGAAAVAGNGPKISGVAETDQVATERRRLIHMTLLRLWILRRNHPGRNKGKEPSETQSKCQAKNRVHDLKSYQILTRLSGGRYILSPSLTPNAA